MSVIAPLFRKTSFFDAVSVVASRVPLSMPLLWGPREQRAVDPKRLLSSVEPECATAVVTMPDEVPWRVRAYISMQAIDRLSLNAVLDAITQQRYWWVVEVVARGKSLTTAIPPALFDAFVTHVDTGDLDRVLCFFVADFSVATK